MSKHTQGPWSIKHEYNVVGSDGRRIIASCGSYRSNGDDYEDVIAENIANAELIAQAPELRRQRDEALQALRSILQHKDSMLSTDIEYIGICQRARRILAQYDKDETK